ncbi:LysR family transcriptional regulator [Pandoraea apista]|uniref:LysR family transcriptional regulator n=1 Tax=Pandoraea apista TaxID=93218 RepID=A0ABX9ZLI1_9BURK|nr:LysR family transcriptional regulator [Pandoraea apista]AJE98354.1 LysR family transcriptional regulator [Pandoraea apista]AKH72407.1 LysR family transcriptional regulator [Pandoraea apista]AKI60797.1 LysR family transcriptional regulator [Pandoraea apista]ALS66164.1 LysR family transcriptional regulator [Pandoraea apista]AVF38963.1 LysR family transcriptional regulator [Pandoraea apista]
MGRQDVNRSGDMEVFTRVVELGGFSAAARALHMTPSAVSKLIARLESRLGARLFNRSTRRLQLTPEGTSFHERALRVLADIEAAEREAAAGAVPRGLLRVNSSVPIGSLYLLPVIPAFLAKYPEIRLDLTLTDTVVDLLEQRADVAVRAGPLRDSRLVARKLGESRVHVVASPEYLARNGPLRSPADLIHHNVMAFNFDRQVQGWPFLDGAGGITHYPQIGNMVVSDGDTMRKLAIEGLGLARHSRYHVDADLRAGRLVTVLEDYNPGDLEPVHAVYVGQGGHLPARVRAFLDFLVANIHLP